MCTDLSKVGKTPEFVVYDFYDDWDVFIHSSFTHCKKVTVQPSHIYCRRSWKKRQVVYPLCTCSLMWKSKPYNTMVLATSINPWILRQRWIAIFPDHVDPTPPNITMSVIKEKLDQFSSCFLFAWFLVWSYIPHSLLSADWSSSHRVTRWRWLCLIQPQRQQGWPSSKGQGQCAEFIPLTIRWEPLRLIS